MPTEIDVQQVIHKLEEGQWAKWLRLALLLGGVIYVSQAWIFKENGFKGLRHPRAFEQAEIAREIARGNGFTTRIIRPAELWVYEQHHKQFPKDQIPDTYHAPLWPAVLSPFLGLERVRKTWPMTERDVQYTSDRVIASVALVFFLMSVAVNFFIARRLFDERLAWLGMGFMLLCDHLWRFSMSGLPQMLMLFLFSLAVYALIRVVEIYELERILFDDEEGIETAAGTLAVPHADPASSDAAPATVKTVRVTEEFPAETEAVAEELEEPGPYSLVLWSAAAGAAFGLLALAHAMGIWVLAGAVLFMALGLGRARLRAILPLVLVTAVIYSPWLVRNYQVCGSPVGIGWYAGLAGIRGTEGAIMRSREVPINGASPTMFRKKVQDFVLDQVRDLPGYLGFVLLAPIFFIALMHPFKRPFTARFRWCALLMWIVAVFGMGVIGMYDPGFKANDLHVLFIPVFTFYGLAYVLVLWSRLEVRVRLVQIGFIGLLYALCGAPFLMTMVELHVGSQNRVEWPPYVPPYIAILASWTNEREIIMSDMPWAVAWYADRRSLWLPMSVKEFNEMNDYNLLQGRIVGLYLTPVSGDEPFLSGIMNGDYKEWAPFILRTGIPRGFALQAVRVLPLYNQCTFYADRDRWSRHED